MLQSCWHACRCLFFSSCLLSVLARLRVEWDNVHPMCFRVLSWRILASLPSLRHWSTSNQPTQRLLWYVKTARGLRSDIHKWQLQNTCFQKHTLLKACHATA